MPEQDGRSPSSRPRPSYGLPGPTEAPDAGGTRGDAGSPDRSAPEPTGPSSGFSSSGSGSSGSSSSGFGSSGHPAPGDSASGPFGSAPSEPRNTFPVPDGGPAPQKPRRRRGIIRIILGLVLLLVVGPAALVIGLFASAGNLVDAAASGPTAMAGSETSLEVPANSLVIVYIPEADAQTAQCTATSQDPGAVSTVPAQGQPITFGDGSTYRQDIGVVASADTTVTIRCTGTTADAGYIGPYSVFGLALPAVIGVGAGIVLGLVGLVLLIVGIVVAVRHRRG